MEGSANSSGSSSRGRSGARMLLRVVLAWLPLAALWTLITLSAEGTDVASAVRFGSVSIGIAALLGYGVWRTTEVYPWPDRMSPGFYLAHGGLGTLYAVAWMVGGMAVNSLIVGLPLLGWHLSASLTFWRFLMGLFLYGLIAGVSYSLRIREQLRRQETATLAAQTLATEARLESLRAQLNPHFLFNALHSVSELMHSDVPAAERSLEGLADLLRYSLDAEAGDVVTLAEEWEFVEGYLALERLRLGDRLGLESRLSEAALGVRVPSFTLQVPVENAVRHAVARRAEGGTIRVSAEVDGDLLRIEVADDGPGFEPGTGGSGDRDGPGRGLALLRQRLDAVYAGAADLVVDSEEGCGTTVVVTVPRRPGRKEMRQAP